MKHKRARKEATGSIRYSKGNYEKDLSEKINTDSKLFWKYVRDN